MAKVARQWLVWQSEPQLDAMGVPIRNELGEMKQERVEVAMDAVVPDTVPLEVQQDWLNKDYIFEDPTKERVEKQEGPPRVSLPPVMTQRLDQARKMAAARGGIPPRPAQKPTI